MGLDLTISEQTDFRTDSKGRTCHTVTELFNIHGSRGHLFLDHVGSLSELSNCSTMTIDAMDIFEGLETLRNMLAEYDTVQVKKDHEEALHNLTQKTLELCELHSISDKTIINKWDSFCTEEELEQKNRITDDERSELRRLENILTPLQSDLKDINELEELISDIEQFNRDCELKKDELTWGDRTFEVHIWY